MGINVSFFVTERERERERERARERENDMRISLVADVSREGTTSPS